MSRSVNLDRLAKKCFANDIEHLGRKALEIFSAKNVPTCRDLRGLARVLVPMHRETS